MTDTHTPTPPWSRRGPQLAGYCCQPGRHTPKQIRRAAWGPTSVAPPRLIYAGRVDPLLMGILIGTSDAPCIDKAGCS